MNTQKLNDFAARAGFDVERLLVPHPGGFPREDMLALESFADLIVEECIKELQNKSFEILDIDCFPHYKERLINYFGIKE